MCCSCSTRVAPTLPLLLPLQVGMKCAQVDTAAFSSTMQVGAAAVWLRRGISEVQGCWCGPSAVVYGERGCQRH
jgi:hypothetical protein